MDWFELVDVGGESEKNVRLKGECWAVCAFSSMQWVRRTLPGTLVRKLLLLMI